MLQIIHQRSSNTAFLLSLHVPYTSLVCADTKLSVQKKKKDKKTTFLFQDPDASYDFNSNDADPEPRPTWNDENRLVTQHVLTDEKLLKFSI